MVMVCVHKNMVVFTSEMLLFKSTIFEAKVFKKFLLVAGDDITILSH
jgi:hypothetical protein